MCNRNYKSDSLNLRRTELKILRRLKLRLDLRLDAATRSYFEDVLYKICTFSEIRVSPPAPKSFWREGANKVAATKLVRNYSDLGLAEAKEIVGSVVEGYPASFKVSDPAQADEVLAGLTDNNFAARRLWSNQSEAVKSPSLETDFSKNIY